MTYLFRERMLRLAMLGFCWDVSYLVSMPLGAYLYNSGSYVCVLGTSLLLYAIACSLGTYRLWGFKEKIIQSSMTFNELISPSHVIQSFKATFKRRPGKKHIYQQLMILAMLVTMSASMSETYCQFMYVKRMFQWEMDDYSYYSTVNVMSRKSNQ